MNWIEKLDTLLFYVIHKGMANPLSDTFFATLTDLHKVPVFSFVVIPSLVAIWIYKRRMGAITQIISLLIGIGATDSLCHYILKPTFARVRPTYAGLEVDKKSQSGTSQYGFPSNHAANATLMAILFGSFFPLYRVPLYFLGFLVGFSRVYLGVHYPSDVLGGAIVGLLIAWAIIEINGYLFAEFKGYNKKPKPTVRQRLKSKSLRKIQK